MDDVSDLVNRLNAVGDPECRPIYGLCLEAAAALTELQDSQWYHDMRAAKDEIDRLQATIKRLEEDQRGRIKMCFEKDATIGHLRESLEKISKAKPLYEGDPHFADELINIAKREIDADLPTL